MELRFWSDDDPSCTRLFDAYQDAPYSWLRYAVGQLRGAMLDLIDLYEVDTRGMAVREERLWDKASLAADMQAWHALNNTHDALGAYFARGLIDPKTMAKLAEDLEDVAARFPAAAVHATGDEDFLVKVRHQASEMRRIAQMV